MPVLKCLIMSKVKALREASTRKDYETYNRSAWVQLRTISCYLVVRISCFGILCHFLLSHDKGRATKNLLNAGVELCQAQVKLAVIVEA